MSLRRRRGVRAPARLARGWRRAAPALVLALLPFAPLAAQETSVTIYSDGRLLVRRQLPLALPRGSSTLAVDLGVREADPSSIVSLDEGVQITRARVIAATGLDGSLRRSLGGDVMFRTGPDSAPRYVRGTLLSLEPPAVRTDGYVLYGLPGTPVFADSMVQLQPRVELTVDAARAAAGLRLMYLSSGLSWSASYTLVLPRGGAGQGTVTGAAQIDNGGAVSLSNAQVQLLAGDVRRARRAPGAQPMMAMGRSALEEAASEPEAEALGGTRVYTLPGTVDLVPGETRTVALFSRTPAAIEPELVLTPQNPYQAVGEWRDAQRDLHPEIGYRVRRTAASPFGAVALPAGAVRVYEPDEAGRPQLVGEAAITHTPPGRDLRVATGTAFDVTATRAQTGYERRGEREVLSGYRVEVQNARAQAAVVQVVDLCPGRCDIVSSSVPGEQPAVGSVSFRLAVPAGGSAALTYQLRARW